MFVKLAPLLRIETPLPVALRILLEPGITIIVGSPFSVQRPPGPLNGRIPLSTEIPAPVRQVT
ncbi:hypothetical protein MUP51_01785 [Candidatus Bathyarchaeota archaeon]|nr:hypothetical protein [Candidatus Bathyarchaeota archaeon]